MAASLRDAEDGRAYAASLRETRLRESVLDLLGPTDDPHMLGRIGPYEIIGLLGQGGMGAVFKGFDRSLNRFVAIKMLLPHLAASGAARKRFAREGQAVAAVVDDHVMAIHCVDEWQGVPYLVMTYSRGVSLQKRLSDNGPLEVREILRIGMQAAKGLAAAHAQGIVHRDIKPANIFLDQNVERVQLMDFGLARAVDDASFTRSGTLAGTPQYMSPEQARAETVDHRSDLFSLGSVMYAMCTGHAPFRAESSYSVLRLITDKEPRPIREINPDVPEWLCAIIGKLMAKDVSERFHSAIEIADLLEGCLAHVQAPIENTMPTIESTNTILEAPQFGKTISMKMPLRIIVLFTAAFSILAYFLIMPPSQTQVGIEESTTQASQAEESTNRNQPPAKVAQAAIPEVGDSVVQSITARKLTLRTLDSETESPIGGVVVRFMQGELGLYVDSDNRYLVTDDKGEASTELSSPNVQIYLSFIPPGYVCTSGAVAVPLSSKNSDEYVMRLTKGTVWQVEAATHNSDASLAQIPFKWMTFASSNTSVANNAMPALSGFPELQVGTCSKLTIPKDSVRFTAQVFHDFMGFSSGGSGLALTIEQDPGFDPNHVTKNNKENDRVQLTDSSSRHAFVDHANVKVDNNRATVSVQIEQPQDALIRLISGRVIDEKRQPIRDASVMLRSDSAGAYGTLCTTNSEGKISSTPLLLAAKVDYEVEVRKRGYKVTNKPLSDANRSQEMQSIDAGSIVLEVGASGKVELMDQHSKPISQASVVLCDERRGQPYADFVTDDTGGVEVSGLYAGKTQVLITAAGYEPIRSEIDAANVNGNLWRFTLLKPAEVRSKSKDLAAESPVVTNPSSKDLSYKKGDSAFPLKTRLWVDEQGRELSADTNLASFKGRAVESLGRCDRAVVSWDACKNSVHRWLGFLDGPKCKEICDHV